MGNCNVTLSLIGSAPAPDGTSATRQKHPTMPQSEHRRPLRLPQTKLCRIETTRKKLGDGLVALICGDEVTSSRRFPLGVHSAGRALRRLASLGACPSSRWIF